MDKSWAQVGARRLAFGHRHTRRDRRVQTQTRSDSLSTVKVTVFITSELPSICARYLFTILHLQPPPPLPSPPSLSLTSPQWHSSGHLVAF